MKDDLNIQVNERRPALFGKMEDDLNIKVNGRRPQFIGKWKTTITFSYKLKIAYLTLASPELGTAQPQLVFSFVKFYLTTDLYIYSNFKDVNSQKCTIWKDLF